MQYQLVTVDDFFANKETYLSVVSLAEREDVAIGQLVKVIMKIADGPVVIEEKLWVEVMEAENGFYIGKLVDGSTQSDNLPAGKNIDFSSEHIIMIW